jgi:hypothetical protein
MNHFRQTVKQSAQAGMQNVVADIHTVSQLLAQTYYFTSHSTRIMALCAAHCDVTRDSLHEFFLRHMIEEMGHHKLAKKDLGQLGFKIENFAELNSTRWLYQPQYYWASFNPIVFYGYGLALEMISLEFGPPLASALEKSGLKSSFVKIHVQEDVQHIDRCIHLLNTMASPEEMHKVKENFEQTVAAYFAMVQEVAELAQSTRLQAVA